MSFLQSSIKILWLMFHDEICLISSLKLYWSRVRMGKGTFIGNDNHPFKYWHFSLNFFIWYI